MKLARTVLFAVFLISFCSAHGQVRTILGAWRLVQQSRCLDEIADNGAEKPGTLITDSSNAGASSSAIVSFKSNSTGEESARILNSGKSTNPKKFLYKFNGEMLLILDKKSQTISDSYMVDKFTADSLIISNASRPCETFIFAKINEGAAN